MTEKTMKVMHSSKKDDWCTPPGFFAELNRQYNFTLDLCARADNALLPRYCEDVKSGMLVDTEYSDTIPIDWRNEVFFCNPPYGRALPKILNMVPRSSRGVFLLPSRTGSRWFQDALPNASWVCFINGRLRFEGAEYSAPFDSVLFVYNLSCPRIAGRTFYGGLLK